MDAVKRGTTIKLEEVQIRDGGEKAYYDVCLPESQILSSVCSRVCSKYDSLRSSQPNDETIHPDIQIRADERVCTAALLVHFSKS